MKAGIEDWEDYLVIGIYFIFVIIVGLTSMCRKNRESVKGYFLAGRSMTWIPIGASLFASNIGSEHFIGLAGSGAASGIGVVLFEWGAVILLIMLGWVFLPIYLKSGVFTMPEYLGRRFGGGRMRIYLSCVAMALYVVTKVSVDVYAGVYFIQLATGLNMYLAMIPLLLVTAVYTIAGGLAAVVLTDTLQTVVMLIGAVILAILAFIEVGGLPGLMYKYFDAVANTDMVNTTSSSILLNSSIHSGNLTSCGIPRADAFHLFRDPLHSDLPWPGVVFRATFASLWNWCADQIIVQRALAAKNMAHAKGATIMAGYLKFTPLFLIIFPGMISRVLYTDEIACTTAEACLEACGNEAGCSNSAYPALIFNLAPVGMRGLLMAVMLAALMSSLTSIFNSAVTVFTMDLWRKGRPAAKEKELLIVGRIFVFVLLGVSIAWMPLLKQSQGGQLFMYIQAVTGYIAPPISALFLMAIFIPRINEQGAFWGIMCGQAVGITRLVLDFVYPSPGCGYPDERPSIVKDVHFTYFSMIVFGVTVVVTLTVSLMTSSQPRSQIKNLTYWTLEKDNIPKPPLNEKMAEFMLPPEDYEPEYPNPYNNVHHGMLHKNGLTNGNTPPYSNDVTSGSNRQWRHALQRFKDTSFSIISRNSDPKPNATTAPVIVFSNAESGSKNIEANGETASTWAPYDITVKSPWSIILNLNALVLITILAFLCGFFH